MESIPETILKLYVFTLDKNKVYCVLTKGQLPIMENFFEKLNNGIGWEIAKDEAMTELIKNEFGSPQMEGYFVNLESLERLKKVGGTMCANVFNELDPYGEENWDDESYEDDGMDVGVPDYDEALDPNVDDDAIFENKKR
jgi:hypothetical protein